MILISLFTNAPSSMILITLFANNNPYASSMHQNHAEVS